MPTTLRGDKELLRTLGRFAGKEMGKAKKRAVQKGLSVVERQAKQNFAKLSKTIPRAIGTVVRTYNDDDVVVGMVGIDEFATLRDRSRGETRTTDLSPLAQKALLLEFGADPHIIESEEGLGRLDMGVPQFFGFKVLHPGTRPKAPMRRAFNTTHSKAQAIQKRELAREIDRIAREGQIRTLTNIGFTQRQAELLV